MRFKKQLKLEYGLRPLDIAPLINIVFLLLLFFMLTSIFIIQPGTKVSLPRILTSKAVSSGNIEIIISADSAVYFNGKVIAAVEFKNLLEQAAKRKQSVLIKADRRVTLETISEIWDQAKASGIVQINIATNQE